jgi:hypothetical protein
LNALVSGVVGRVVFIEGADVSYIDAESPDTIHRSCWSDVGLLLAGATDLVEFKQTGRAEVLACLLRLWNNDRAVRMLELIFDEDGTAVHAWTGSA